MEEAPAPSSIINEKKIKKLNSEIQLNSNNKYFLDLTGYQTYLNINIKLNNQNKEFEEKFSLDKIKNISKYFLMCESISDVISVIEPNINQSNIIEENNNIKLIISLNHPLCKEAIFIIPEKIKVYNPTELYYIISELRMNNQNQKEIIKSLQNKVNELSERVIVLENKPKEKNNNEIISYLNDSKIIKKDYEKGKAIKIGLIQLII